jgi:hypothetical protein
MQAIIFLSIALASCVWALRFESKKSGKSTQPRKWNGQFDKKAFVTYSDINGGLE